MANVKIIDLPTGSPESDSFLEATQVNEQAASGRSSAKIAFNALANWIAGQGADPVEYGDLNTEDETLIGGINELHGVDGYDVYDETRTSSNKYVQGDICIHSDSLQVCTAAAGAYGAWDSSKWSPTTIKALLALKQNSTDNSLTTTNKQIVPAINELKSGKQDALNKGSIINVDLNTLKSNGVYFVNGSGTALNAPTNTYYGILEVVAASVILQRSTNLGPEGTGVTQYERIFINNAWTSWKKITRNIT